MVSLARWSFNRRRLVVAGWLLILLAVGFLGQRAGSTYRTDVSLPGTDSQQATDLLKRDFAAGAGESDTIVWRAAAGSVRDTTVKSRIEPALARIAALHHVRRVASPYRRGTGGRISPDGRTAFALVAFGARAGLVPEAAVRAVIHAAAAARSPTLRVELGGDAVGRTERPNLGFTALVGIVGAAVILLLAFGSLPAMLLPIASAVAGVGLALSSTALLSHGLGVADFAPDLATLIGLGVGIDYALFIVSRYRAAILRGQSGAEAVSTALDTSGRAVLFAGATVCIALLGLFALRVSLFYGVALSAVFAVVFTMAASLTLLPALLGFLGPRVISRRARRRAREQAPAQRTRAWERWAALVRRRPGLLALAATSLLILLAVPFFSVRLGAADQGNNPVATHTTRRAYDLLATGFGAGFNGPLELAAEVHRPVDRTAVADLAAAVRRTPGVAAVGRPRFGPGGRAAVFEVYPTTSPQAAATERLLNTLRGRVIPMATRGSGVVTHVGGVTATYADFAGVLADRLPLFIAAVVGLSFLLLLLAFRSLFIPTLAAAMNLLAAGAAFGVLVAVFQWGWAARLIGVDRTGPIEAFIPVLVFAILFGLSMDYQVFLVGRMREAWIARGDNGRAVDYGIVATGRLITAAASIMVLVFGSFAVGGERVLKLFGVGLAVAVLLDALVIRTVLVPALMHLAGRANWSLPRRLERALPRLSIEGGANDDDREAGTPPSLRPLPTSH
jgi:RND superfamily putative drug exporter